LKEFHSAGRGFWHDVSDADWNDWRWQLKHRITTAEQLQKFLPTLTPEEFAGAKLANTKLALAITPYFFNLIDPADENCPVRLQVIPKVAESRTAPWEMSDPVGEDSHSPVPGLVHRYPDRVLFLVTDRCAAYCRYCTRSRLVSNASGYDFHPDFDKQIAYIARHPEIRDVLLSGGDPLLLSDDKLENLLGRLRAIPHVEFLRIGSRIPTFLPQRITPELCAMLKKFHPLFMSVHSNHPRELTTEVRDALGRLADAGIPLGNQSVLLKHINDDADVMNALVQKLLMCRVKPYYLYQCDLISGSAHLRASVAKGLEIMEKLRGHTTGYAVPTYVIDAPGGGGKVPIAPEYVLCRNAGRVLIRNFEGKVFEYPEADDGTPLSKPPKEIEKTELCKC
ncbi:MAG TPA: KamA family radical SAM protein, partial [Candidatus Paceibacterota bacterium]|nr:KamA family radical SAM protein [Candidatus Paceibacterota bacterium]